jgi:hypothetical protein
MDALLFTIAALSSIVAVIMTTVVWRMRREERRRSDARVAALAAAIEGDDIPLRPAHPQQVAVRANFFSSPAGSGESAGRRWAGAAALGVFVVAAVAAFAVVAGRARTVIQSHSDRPAGAQGSSTAPLELLALEHDREGDRFIVRGIVRNPTAATIDGVDASVSVFDRDGRLISSGRAAVAVRALASGTETPFVVAVSGADDVDRYHLSFRTAAGIVPHLDRRVPAVMVRLP